MESLDVALVVQNAVRRDGQGRWMVELALELDRRGHDVTVYAHSIDESLAERVAFHAVRQAPGPQVVDDLVMLAASSRAVGRNGHDVACVLGHTAWPDCPTVYTPHFSHRGWRRTWASGGRPPLRHRLNARVAARLEDLSVRRADSVVTSTATLAAEVANGVPADVSVVPNGVDLDEFATVTAAERRRARDEAGLDGDDFVIGFLGEYRTPRKGLAPLLQALEHGPSRERLVIGGVGRERWLESERARRRLGERLVALGFADPRSVIAASDVVAVPSLYEPWSLVALEAAACGIPVILSARAGAAEALGSGAVVVEQPDDPGELRAALDLVRAEPDLAARVAAEGQERVRELTWTACAGRTADVIERTARGWARGATPVGVEEVGVGG